MSLRNLVTDRTQTSISSTVLRTNRRHTYSRTCLVLLNHLDTKMSVVGPAIIDDQLSVTFIDPGVTRALQLPSHLLTRDTLVTTSVQGDSKSTQCQTVH